MPVTGALCLHHLWAYRCNCDRQVQAAQRRNLLKLCLGSMCTTCACEVSLHRIKHHTSFICCTYSARLMSEQRLMSHTEDGLHPLSVAARIRFNHLPPLKKQTVNLHWGLWGCGATWHFHPISSPLLRSMPAIRERSDELVSGDTLQRGSAWGNENKI